MRSEDSQHDTSYAPTIGPKPHNAKETMLLHEQVWPRSAERNDSGVVTIAGLALTELVAEFGSPLFVIDEEDFRSRCREIAQAFGGAERVHYASKAFLCTEIASWVAQEGLGLDVASGGELAVALRAGFPAHRITVHGNNKSAAEIRCAIEAGVGHLVIDSLQEIARAERIATELGTVQDVFIRVTTGVEAHTHEFISTAHEDQKFGFSIAGGAAMEAARAVSQCEHLRLTGLHSHIGSQIFELDGFELAAQRVLGLLRDIIDESPQLAQKRTENISTVDLGGGLGICYTPYEDAPPVAELAIGLRRVVSQHAKAAGLPAPTLVVEPGRAIAGPGTVTVYEVGTTKDVQLSSGETRRYVSVDGGMSDNIRPALYGARYHCRVVSRNSEAEPIVARVVGKHCESGDIVVNDAWLPADVAPGDLLAVAATGAYCYSMSSRYNLLCRPAVVAVKNNTARLILRRETVEDLVSLEV